MKRVLPAVGMATIPTAFDGDFRLLVGSDLRPTEGLRSAF
jgi:hypothetical protein